jgi:glutamate formiminotransferase
MAIQLIECVPSFSEGRRPDVIEAITTPFRDTPGCHLLDHRADEEENRLEVSLAGRPGPVQEALMTAARVALETIDMNTHNGRHPRIGAVDAITFTPVENISMEACTALARDFGRRLYHETEIPVYFYGDAAMRPERRRLEDIRKGGYEILKIEASIPERQPDVGEPRLHPTAGAAAIGAGKPLVNLNINLRTTELDVAVKIADAVGAQAGGLCHVEGTGRFIEERGMVQVRLTVADPDLNPLYRVLEMVRMEARRWGVEVAKTDIPGMVPAAALIQSAAYYLQAAGFHLDQVTELRLLAAMGDDA